MIDVVHSHWNNGGNKMKTNLFQQIEYTKEIDLFDLVKERDKEVVKNERNNK